MFNYINLTIMRDLKKMKSKVSDEFSVLTKESLLLVLGGKSHSVTPFASCGSTGSSSSCDGTAVCNCCVSSIKKS